MKLNKRQKALLAEMNIPETDYPQIEAAAAKTTYLLFQPGYAGLRIGREQAIKILGEKEWLSGLYRSAFHVTSVRIDPRNEARHILFNSRRYFQDRS